MSLSLDFAPLLPWWLLAALGVVAVVPVAVAARNRSPGTVWRLVSFAVVLVALCNPRLVQETRDARPDIALLVVDQSASAQVGERAMQIEAARQAILARLNRLSDLEVRTVEVPEAGTQGTRMFLALERALTDIPRRRLAGVVALSDGQVHDVPAQTPVDAPFHLLLPGRPGEIDRRLRVIEAPGFGIVGRTVEINVAVDDLGATDRGAQASLTVRPDGGTPRTERVRVGESHRISVPIERGGPMVVELTLAPLQGEVSTANNRAAITINGVRDRLRVLLVSGEPHAGERTWRRLLKADPGVDLVHFTILRPPEKDDLTPLHELALIAFPVRELFQQKLRDFDLIVFDRFANRGVLPPAYLRNVADYVRGGGTLFLSVGPEFAGPASLATTPLGAILPARPVGRLGSTDSAARAAVVEGPFRARVTAVGLHHPVTEGLAGANGLDAAEPQWGRWYRSIRAETRSGVAVMETPDGAPLLTLDRVGEGRVALLLSDQIWLWSRGHDGGGPQAELLRRAAHWLMKEPQLEEENLTARIENGTLYAERRSLSGTVPPTLRLTAPDGAQSEAPLSAREGGRSTATAAAAAPGVWQVSDGARTAFVAAGATNPLELADLRAVPAALQPIMAATGGAPRWLGSNPAAPVLPEFRLVAPGRDASGPGWLGLRRNGDHSVIGIRAVSLMPGWLTLLLVLSFVALAWKREGR